MYMLTIRRSRRPRSRRGGLCQLSQEEADKDKDAWQRLPSADQAVTQHRISTGGRAMEYTATAGTLVVRDDADKPIANMGYIGLRASQWQRPERCKADHFAFNGGPGSSSLWLHMGVLGPRAWSNAMKQPTPPAPYRSWTTSSACSTRATW